MNEKAILVNINLPDPYRLEADRWNLLLIIYRLLSARGAGAQLGIPLEELYRECQAYRAPGEWVEVALAALAHEGLVAFFFEDRVSLLNPGRKMIEEYSKMKYVEHERQILKLIYERNDRKAGNPARGVLIANLEKLTPEGIDLNSMLLDLERRHLINSTDATVWILPEGIRFLEQESRSESGAVNSVFIGGDNFAQVQAGGHGNVQKLRIAGIEEFDKALAALIDFIGSSSSLTLEDKHECINDLEKVRALAAEGKPERALKKLEYVKLALTGADILSKTLPYWPAAFAYLQQ